MWPYGMSLSLVITVLALVAWALWVCLLSLLSNCISISSVEKLWYVSCPLVYCIALVAWALGPGSQMYAQHAHQQSPSSLMMDDELKRDMQITYLNIYILHQLNMCIVVRNNKEA
jgi:hypothetical protein